MKKLRLRRLFNLAKATGQGAGNWAQDLCKDQSLYCAVRIPSGSETQSPQENREGRKNGKGNRERESRETTGLADLEGRVRQPENQKPEEEERKAREEVGAGRES